MKSSLTSDQLHKLYEYIYRGGVLRYLDRQEWGLSTISIEHFLSDLATVYKTLLVGSPAFVFYDEYVRTGSNGNAMATDHGGVAILQAIFSTEKADLYYPLQVSQQMPLKVDIVRKHPGRIVVDKGYVYVIKTPHGFTRDQNSSWRWTTQSSTNQIGGSVEVVPRDFNYPVCGPINLYDK